MNIRVWRYRFPWGEEEGVEGKHFPKFSMGREMPMADDVDAHVDGESWCGVGDLVGNVYQWTDVFMDEHTDRAVVRGGNRWRSDVSFWYERQNSEARRESKANPPPLPLPARRYEGYKPGDQVIQWFWNVVLDLKREDKAKLVQFITGTSKVPLEGFANLQGMRGTQIFNIHRAFGENNLPSAHTCFNQLDLPQYKDEKTLKMKLMTAINEGSEGFGFA